MELQTDIDAPVPAATRDDLSAVRLLAARLEVEVHVCGADDGRRSDPPRPAPLQPERESSTATRALLVVCLGPAGPSSEDLARIRDALRRRRPVVLAIGAAAADGCAGLEPALRLLVRGPALAVPSTEQPLVLDPHLRASGLGRLSGLALEADDLVSVDVEARQGHHANELAQVRSRADHDGIDREVVLARSIRLDEGPLHVVGSAAFLTDRWLSAADNAAILTELLHELRTSAGQRSAAAAVVAQHRPEAPRPHAPLPVLQTAPADWATWESAVPALHPEDPLVVRAAAPARRRLPAEVHDALVALDEHHEGDDAPLGALLIRGVPIGEVPATPASPTARPDDMDLTSEFALLTIARTLGQPVGYAPEHGGMLVQNLLPTRDAARRQTSTSSAVELEFHTETAFHPHRPRFLLLLCLRGDPAASTLLCSVTEVVHQLPLWVRRVLSEPRFRTGVDESFSGGSNSRALGPRRPVLSGDPSRPTLVFDADLMQATDDEAEAALTAFRELAIARRIGVTLSPGDALVVDNHVCIHGRSPFTARFDGTDRWLQRSFVVSDLSASSGERTGRVITTRFV